MKCPAEVYHLWPYTGLPDIDYPLLDKTIVVTRCGRTCLGNNKINVSQVFAGQAVGIKDAGGRTSGASASWTTTWAI